MPRTADWIHRLTEIEQCLGSISEPFLDRAAIEKVFQVSKRQANRILAKMGASQLGGAMVVSSADLILRLSQLQQDERIEFDIQRRQRLEEKLNAARKEIRARRIRVPAPAGNFEISNLPQEIRLSPGSLEIRFTSPVELLEKLAILGQAISDDWDTYEFRVSHHASMPA